MKNEFLLLRAALTFCLCCQFLSCGKDRPDAPNPDNPPVLDLPGAAFSLRVLDHEHGYHKDSAYVFEGIWQDGHFRFGRERLDTMQLNIAPDNAIILTVQAGEAAFTGVNAASSARCINIVPDGPGRDRFHLERVAEGSAVITLWNGEGAERREIRFTATSRREIPLEGIRVRIDGREETLCTMMPFGGQLSLDSGTQPREYACYYRTFAGFRREDPSRHVSFEIAGPVPLNANTGTLHPVRDDIGLEDHGAFYEALPPHRWLKAYGLYEGNLEMNPGFRWFRPFVIGKVPEGDWRYPVEDISREYFRDDAFALNPQDLRERYAWIWPMAYGTAFTFSLAEGPRIEKKDGLYHYDKVHQVRILFPDAPKIPWEVYY